MADKPSPDETALWQRRLASQANNRAWALAEMASRTAAEDEELLQAAHAAMFFWNIVGQAGHKAHAAQLLAHAYAALRLAHPAAHYLAKSQPFMLDPAREPWERALAHAVAAHVAAAAGDTARHAEQYRLASQQTAALADAEDRRILEATLRILPVPAAPAS